MSPLSSLSLMSPLLAQAPNKSTAVKNKATTTQPVSAAPTTPESPFWMYTSIGLAVALVVLGVTSALQYNKLNKRLRFEMIKNRETGKRAELAVETISKMERNPDLIHSRDFNLDYLRMRMAEEKFRFSIVNQSKIKIKSREWIRSGFRSILEIVSTASSARLPVSRFLIISNRSFLFSLLY